MWPPACPKLPLTNFLKKTPLLDTKIDGASITSEESNNLSEISDEEFRGSQAFKRATEFLRRPVTKTVQSSRPLI